jgi:hypothetical protein
MFLFFAVPNRVRMSTASNVAVMCSAAGRCSRAHDMYDAHVEEVAVNRNIIIVYPLWKGAPSNAGGGLLLSHTSQPHSKDHRSLRDRLS